MRCRIGLGCVVTAVAMGTAWVAGAEPVPTVAGRLIQKEELRLMREGTGAQREDAIYGLAKLGVGDASVREALHGALASKVWQERFLAVHALAAADPQLEQAGPWLAERMEDQDRRVRAAAFERLIDSGGGKFALPRLLALMKSAEPETRKEACNLAGRMKEAGKEAVPRLIEIVGSDPDLMVRAEAACSLSGLGGDGVVKALVAAIRAADAAEGGAMEKGAGKWWALRWHAIEGVVGLSPELPELAELAKTGSADTREHLGALLKERKEAATRPAANKVAADFTGRHVVDLGEGRKAEAEYVGGVLEGRSRYLDAKGGVEYESYYAQGKRDGVWKWYRVDGTVSMEEHYYRGMADGLSMHEGDGEWSEAVRGTNRFGQHWEGTFANFQRGADVYAHGELQGWVTRSGGDEGGFKAVRSRREGAGFAVTQLFNGEREILARKEGDNGMPVLLEGTVEVWDVKAGKWVKREYAAGRVAGSGPLPAELHGLVNPNIRCHGGMAVLEDAATDSDMLELAGFPTVKSLRLGGRNVTDAGMAVLAKLPGLEEIEIWSAPISSAGMEYLQGLKHLKRLDLRLTKVGDEGMRYLKGLTELRELVLDRTAVTDAGLAHIGTLKKLEKLNLYGTKITDAGLAHLAAMESLTELDLPSTALTDAGLVRLRALRGHLEKLWISETKITDEGLATLVDFPELKHLSINDTAITDAGMTHVGKMVGLEWLDVDRTGVTGAGLAKLAGLKKLKGLFLRNLSIGDKDLAMLAPFENLTDLYLDNDRVTDGGLGYLANVKSLTTVSLFRTPVTAKGIEALKAALPKARVER